MFFYRQLFALEILIKELNGANLECHYVYENVQVHALILYLENSELITFINRSHRKHFKQKHENKDIKNQRALIF